MPAVCFKSSLASRCISSPLWSSVPLFKRPTFAFFHPYTASAYAEAISAKCTRFTLLHSRFAPQSQSSVPRPEKSGILGQSAGRETPLILPSVSTPAVSTAPVAPLETTASALPSFKRRNAVTVEESFFVRTALVGISSFVITSGACTISTREESYV